MSLFNAFEKMATEESSKNAVSLLTRIVALLSSPRGYDKTTARQRGTVVVESGTVTTVTTVNTVTNLATLTNFGAGRDAGQMMVNPINRTSWALNHRSRIS